jgi:UPF0716 protein FxsA
MPYLLVFLLLPLVEIRLFAYVAGLIGPWPVFGLTLLSMAAGAALLRMQGWRLMAALRDPAADMPGREIFDGLCLAVAGFLFIVPGFFSDFIALLLLVPQMRRVVGGALLRWAGLGGVRPQPGWQGPRGDEKGPGRPQGGDVIEGDYERVEEE